MKSDVLGVLERIRTVEADVERAQESIVHQQMLTIDNRRHQILRDHFIKSRLATISTSVEKLLDMYLDEDDIVEARDAPSVAESEDETPGFLARVMQSFEAQVSTLREYHARNSDIPPTTYELDVPTESLIAGVFTTAERFGECLDLASPYEQYSTFMIETKKENDTLEKRLEYMHFVANLPRVILETPLERKLMRFDLYCAFITGLAHYMQDFYRRVKPLNPESLQVVLDKVAEQNTEYFGLLSSKAAAVHLKRFVKLFAPYDLNTVHGSTTPLTGQPASVEQLSLMEGQVLRMVSSILSDAMIATEKLVTRNQCKSNDELKLEREKEDRVFHESVAAANAKSAVTFTDIVAHEDLDKIKELQTQDADRSLADTASHASTLNMRFGIDGKPIDRWIVVMQQLDTKFPCEVCGGTVYDGPKNFVEHFRAERHIGALAKLGAVKNLRLYEGLTEIRRVIEMRNKLESASASNTRRRMREDELAEEIQDVQGNVMTTRDFREYQDRRRNL